MTPFFPRDAMSIPGRTVAIISGFSILVNLLVLTGPIFMLQVYDRVLGSRSEETLLVLVALMTGLYLAYGILDHVRGRLLARAGDRLSAELEPVVFEASIRRQAQRKTQTAMRDLEAVRGGFSLPALAALFDLPFTPLFVVLIFLFHPWLGWLSVAGGALVIALALATQVVTKEVVKRSQGESQAAYLVHRQTEAFADYVVAQGLLGAMRRRWQEIQTKALTSGMLAADRAGALGSASKALRLFLQSAMLGLGAWLALKGEVSAGAMIAASILLGRALAPIEQVVGQWPALQKSWIAWGDLKAFLDEALLPAPRTPLPRPAADVGVSSLTVVPGPGKAPLLQGVSFILPRGQALGVIGPSGSGKTTLARVLTGLVPPSMGEVRLGGATLDQYGDELGRHVGYLPQMPQLFDATIAENIARMDTDASPEAIIAAAQAARAHELILGLGKGYDTSLRDAPLSGGQMQRVALARALYGNPALLVLDEPTSALDEEGSRALNEAILAAKAEGRSVVLMTHRPSAIAACDMILKLEGGRATAFGPRDEVLGKTVRNFPQIKGTFVQGTPS